MPKRIKMSGQARWELILRLVRKEGTAAELACEASISEATLYKWRDEFLKGALAGMNGGDGDLRQQLRLKDKVLTDN